MTELNKDGMKSAIASHVVASNRGVYQVKVTNLRVTKNNVIADLTLFMDDGTKQKVYSEVFSKKTILSCKA